MEERGFHIRSSTQALPNTVEIHGIKRQKFTIDMRSGLFRVITQLVVVPKRRSKTTTTRYVTTQKSTILVYFAAEA